MAPVFLNRRTERRWTSGNIRIQRLFNRLVVDFHLDESVGAETGTPWCNSMNDCSPVRERRDPAAPAAGYTGDEF